MVPYAKNIIEPFYSVRSFRALSSRATRISDKGVKYVALKGTLSRNIVFGVCFKLAQLLSCNRKKKSPKSDESKEI